MLQRHQSLSPHLIDLFLYLVDLTQSLISSVIVKLDLILKSPQLSQIPLLVFFSAFMLFIHQIFLFWVQFLLELFKRVDEIIVAPLI